MTRERKAYQVVLEDAVSDVSDELPEERKEDEERLEEDPASVDSVVGPDAVTAEVPDVAVMESLVVRVTWLVTVMGVSEVDVSVLVMKVVVYWVLDSLLLEP